MINKWTSDMILSGVRKEHIENTQEIILSDVTANYFYYDLVEKVNILKNVDTQKIKGVYIDL